MFAKCLKIKTNVMKKKTKKLLTLNKTTITNLNKSVKILGGNDTLGADDGTIDNDKEDKCQLGSLIDL